MKMPRFITILFVLFVAPHFQVHAGECSKTARWNNDPPYSMQGKDGEIHGIHPDLLREIMKRIPCDVKFVEMPWARALVELKSGRLDILMNASITAERQEFAHFSRPTDRSRNVLFVSRKNDHKYHINKLADIIGTEYRLGVQINAVYSEEYEALLKNPNFTQRLTQISDLNAGWKMLDAGRIDGQLADELTGLIEIESLGLSNSIKVSDIVISNDPGYAGISKASNDEKFVKQFNDALGSMMVDGSYIKIMEKNLPCKVSVKNLGCK
jgi:polar amino acid transport system substrate-binding protein